MEGFNFLQGNVLIVKVFFSKLTQTPAHNNTLNIDKYYDLELMYYTLYVFTMITT